MYEDYKAEHPLQRAQRYRITAQLLKVQTSILMAKDRYRVYVKESCR